MCGSRYRTTTVETIWVRARKHSDCKLHVFYIVPWQLDQNLQSCTLSHGPLHGKTTGENITH